MTTLLTLSPAQIADIADHDSRLRIGRVLNAVRRDCAWPLPMAALVIRPEAAYLTVAGLEDLRPWVAAFLGPVVAVASPAGFEVWTLLAEADDWRGGGPVKIRVAATVVAGETDLGSFVTGARS